MADATRAINDSERLSGAPIPAQIHTGYIHTDMTYELNRLAKSLVNGHCTLADDAAANKWAATSNLALVGALNAKNSTTTLGLRAVCNALGNTTNQDPATALSAIETPA